MRPRHAAALRPKSSKASANIGRARPRLFGGQHAAAMMLEQFGGHIDRHGRRIERPTEMFAGVTTADGQSMVTQHFLIEHSNQIELRRRAAA